MCICDPTQQVRPTAEEQLQCWRKTVSEKSRRVDKTERYEDIGPKYGNVQSHACQQQPTYCEKQDAYLESEKGNKAATAHVN